MNKKKKIKQKKEAGFSNLKVFELLLSFFRENNHKTFNYKQVSSALKIKDFGVKIQIVDVMKEMKASGILNEVNTGSYKLIEEKKTLFATIKSSNKAGCFAKTEDEKEIFIAKENSLFVLSGDEVELRLFQKRKKVFLGRVVKVLKRKKTSFVGCIDYSSSNYFLVPDDKSVFFDIFLPQKSIKSSYLNKKVLVEVKGWNSTFKNPIGEVVEIIGPVNDHSTEINSIIFDYGFSPKFTNDVLFSAKNLPSKISKKEIKKRVDARRFPTFTIDPKDAKDFDDALSVRKLKNNNWEIGVHIADVSYYVLEGGVIDKEAEKRTTSVYLVDRVVPMLPEFLSNNLCSLKPGVDRLCYSVFFEITSAGKLIDYNIAKTVIHSDFRFTYSEAQEIINNKKGKMVVELSLLDKISKIFRKKRFQNGSINFESNEFKFVLDEKNHPIDVYFKKPLGSNHLIEEFMLLTNKTVAEHIDKIKKEVVSFVYRVHSNPDSDKINSLNKLIKKFGYSINTKNPKTICTSLNSLLKETRGTAEQKLVDTLVVRSMAKAIYTTNNIGHFGLGFDYYSHFTSPIRRYPDLIVHRLLTATLSTEKTINKNVLEKLCKHCSEREKFATHAERDSVKYMQVKFLKNKIGKKYYGVICGVKEWGLYVEITDNGCEGLVKINSIKDDHYIYDEKKYALIGYRKKIVYQLGQKVKIRIKSADLKRKQLDFVLI